LCGEPSVVVVSITPSPPPSEPCQPLILVDSGGSRPWLLGMWSLCVTRFLI
jgi:hypothetical protein